MEWINANDRLPEVECGCGESVLAISNSGEMLVLYYDGKCWFGADGKVRDSKFKITHWMPLPKKPKGTSMERITSNRPWAEAQKNLSNEMGYSHIWIRLNAIEDILGEDYDLDRLRELVEADRDGRCVVMPCSGWMETVFGDQETFYGIDHDYLENPVREISVDSSDRCTWYDGWKTVVIKGYDENGCDWEFSPEEIGKTVFRTREAAEAALKGDAYGG